MKHVYRTIRGWSYNTADWLKARCRDGCTITTASIYGEEKGRYQKQVYKSTTIPRITML